MASTDVVDATDGSMRSNVAKWIGKVEFARKACESEANSRSCGGGWCAIVLLHEFVCLSSWLQMLGVLMNMPSHYMLAK